MASGLVINLSRTDGSFECERDHEPAITLDDGTLIFEVWLFHPPLARWFVMTCGPHDPNYVAQGVVYFHPNDVPDVIRARVRVMEIMQQRPAVRSA